MTVRLAPPVRHRGLAFMAGVGFAALPMAGPFLAVLGVVTGHLEVQRADRWWWLCALLLGASFLAAGYALDAVLATAQVLAVWLLYRGAGRLRATIGAARVGSELGAGLVFGLTLTFAFGLTQIEGIEWTALTALDALVWQTNPGMFGHTMLVLAALVALVAPAPALRVVALAIGALGVVVSGAQEAAIAWIVVALGLRLLNRRRRDGSAGAEWTMLAVMVALATGFGSLFGVGRTAFLIDVVPGTTGPNLLRGTELPSGDWWYPLGTTFTAHEVIVDGTARVGMLVTKVSPEPWARLQQVVTLFPDTQYTLSVAWRAQEGGRPGLDGWGRLGDASAPAVVSTTRDADGLVGTATGPMRLLGSDLVDLGGGWQRASVTFEYVGDRPLAWYTGPVVDRSDRLTSTLLAAEFQLTESAAPLPYVPGVATRGVVDLRWSRLPIWEASAEAVAHRPLFGWGPHGLPRSIDALAGVGAAVAPVAAHAHNLLLDVLVDRGLVGAAGVLLLIGLLALRALQARDGEVGVILLALLVMNVFDSTLLSGSILYPVAVVLGWRAAGGRAAAPAATDWAGPLAVRGTLAVADLAAAVAAFGIAGVLVGGWPAGAGSLDVVVTIVYVSLAWPLANAWLGHYPGYGRPPWQELRGSVIASATAGVALFMAHAIGTDLSGLDRRWLVVATLLAALVSALARPLAKRALLVAGFWGRRVAVVGHRGSADGVALELLQEPLLGLAPAVLVDAEPPAERPAELARIAGSEVPMGGPYRHVVVVPGGHSSQPLDEVLASAGRRSFRIVQVVPAVGPIPTSDVVARTLGRELSLEVRNNLAAGTNRAIKRAFDVVAVALGGLVAFPVMALVGLVIRLESPGPALFRQERIGRDGGRFHIWKFRTMQADAEERLAHVLASDPGAQRQWELNQKLDQDPRVTRVGRLLRATSLDELPQLWNVLRGEMSLVGPRPIVQSEVARYGDQFELYTQVRPGMSGLWQISGRSDTDYTRRVHLDAYYVRNWSVWLDLAVLAKTVQVVVDRRGAY